MKKIISCVAVTAMLISNLSYVYAEAPTLSYTAADMENLRALIENCETAGHNTDYEMLNYTVLNRFITYTAEDTERGVSEERLTHNTNYLNNLYTETVNNLNGYLNGTKVSKSKGYDYKTGDFNISGNIFITDDKAPFFSSGYGHGSEASGDISIFPDMGMNNIQMEIDASFAVSDNDGIPYWKYTAGSTGGSVEVDDTVGYNSSKSLKIINPSELAHNVYLMIYQDVPVKPYTDYTLTFYAKGDSVDSRALVVYNNWNNDVKYSVTSDWTKYTYQFTTGSECQTTIRLNIVDKAAGLWLDGFELSGSVIENSGFEMEASDKEYEVYPYNDFMRNMRYYLANAEKNNVAVCLLLSPHYLKTYIANTYPDVMSSKFGLMNFNVNDTRIKALYQDYVTEMIKAVKDFDCIEGICITNEPTFNTSADVDFYEPLYQEFLKEKYGSISTLNSAWGTYKFGFKYIDMPEAWATTPAYYDWMEFNEKVFSDWHAWYADLVRENMKGTKLEGVPVFTKMMASQVVGNTKAFMDAGFDPFDFAKWQDVIGFDSSSTINGGRIEKLQATDLLTSTADKPLWNSENHIISDGDENYTTAHASHVYNDLWQHAIHGLNASTIWVWSRTTNAADAKYGSILNRPDAIVAAGRATLDLNRNADVVNAFADKKKTVALYYSKSSNLYNRDNYKPALTAVYEKLLMDGIRCGFVSEDKPEDFDKYDTIVIPAVTNTTANAFAKLKEWKANGGKVIFVGDGCLAKNEYNKAVSDTVSGTTVTNDTLSEQFDIRYYPVNPDGTKADNVSVEDVLYNGETYFNICNYSDTDSKTVYLTDDGAILENYYDLISETWQSRSITLEPLETKLIKYDDTVKGFPDKINLITSNVYAGVNTDCVGDKLNISWTNPDYEISEIKLSEQTLGVIEGAFSSEPGAFNHIQLTDLVKDTIYTFTVAITDSSGNTINYITTGKPGSYQMNRLTEERYKTIWNYKFEGHPSVTGYFLDFGEKHSGYSSLMVVQNGNNQNAHFKVENDNHDYVEVGSEYEFSFWMKSELSGEKSVNMINDWTGQYYLDLKPEWTKYAFKIYDITLTGGKYSYKLLNLDNGDVITYSGLSNNRFCPRLIFINSGRVWVDEMQLRKYNEDGTLGNNTFIDGEFEWGGDCYVSVTEGDDNATVKWKNPASGYIMESVLVDENNNIVHIGNTNSSGENTVSLTELEKGRTYGYRVRMIVNGVTVFVPATVKIKARDIVISEADGTVTAEISEYTDGVYDYYLASYDSEGRLVGVDMGSASETLSTVSSAEHKVFVWDGMKPIQ